MKYFLISGEASGDLHGANLIRELKKIDNQADFCFFGGDNMSREAAVKPLRHIKDMAFMGVWDVIKNYKKIKDNLILCKKQLLEYKPDVVILIDYPGFNLKIAEFAHNQGFKVFYYISPKIWAWNKKRAYKIKRFVDKMFVIFPFEIDFYKRYNYQVEYLGNPTVDEVYEFLQKSYDKEKFYRENGLDKNLPVIALLPGSRRQELKYLLPVMNKIASKLPDYQFVIAGMSILSPSYYKSLRNLKIVWDNSYLLLRFSYAALVTSGTATLETALFKVPQVVMYKTAWLQYLIGSIIVRIKFFSLVNIIAGKEVVKELLQYNLVERGYKELKKILYDKHYYESIKDNYKIIIDKLGPSGCAERTAKRIYTLLKKNEN